MGVMKKWQVLSAGLLVFLCAPAVQAHHPEYRQPGEAGWQPGEAGRQPGGAVRPSEESPHRHGRVAPPPGYTGPHTGHGEIMTPPPPLPYPHGEMLEMDSVPQWRRTAPGFLGVGVGGSFIIQDRYGKLSPGLNFNLRMRISKHISLGTTVDLMSHSHQKKRWGVSGSLMLHLLPSFFFCPYISMGAGLEFGDRYSADETAKQGVLFGGAGLILRMGRLAIVWDTQTRYLSKELSVMCTLSALYYF